MPEYGLTFIVALAVAFVITPGVIWLAFRTGALDTPEARKVHKQPVPRIGGLGIYLAFMAAMGVYLMTAEVPAFLASLLLVMTVGEIITRLGKHHPPRMELMDAAALLVFLWPVAAAVSAVPFVLSGALGPIDALSLAMMSLSTGGGADLPVFMREGNPWLELAAILSMLLACGNFLLYRQALRRRDFRLIWQDTELRLFFLLLLLFSLAVSAHLWYAGVYDLADSLRYGFFEVISFSSTSGFMAAPVAAWPDLDRFLLLLLVFIGGCIGSLTGGLKIKRLVILFRMTLSEMKRTLHPHMVERIRVGKETVSMRIVGNILCYFFLQLAVFYVFTALLSLSDITLPEAVGLGVGMLSSVGTASGLYGFDTYANLAPGFKLLCCFFMLVGRMEIFALLLWLGGRAAAEHRW